MACGTHLYFCVVVNTLFTLWRQCRDQYSYTQSRTSPQKCALSGVVLLCCPQAVTFVHRERGGASVCLFVYRGFVGSSFALCPRSHRFQIRFFWTASVEPADVHPTVFLTPEPSTVVFRVCCGTVISQSSQVLTAKHRMLNPSPITRSRYMPHSSGHGLSS